MRSSRIKTAIACCALLTACLLLNPASSYSLESEIRIAPNVLNIQSGGTVVTVHTDISYYAVDVYTVYLNGIAISSWKADNRGNFVAKFSMDAVKTLDGLAIGDMNTLQIVGATLDGEPFVGEQDIMVIDVIPQGR
jgi:hypothetical protein